MAVLLRSVDGATRDAVQWWRVPIDGNMSVDATAENRTGLNYLSTFVPTVFPSVASWSTSFFFEFPIGTFALLDYLVDRQCRS